ncbi:MAG: hypothetical protein ACI8O8_001427 [Oleiphilaceae bacterium]|jgi:hypothetical protein
MKLDADDNIQTGAAEFITVKAGCGIRFDPDTLTEDAGFNFSQAEKLVDKNDQDQSMEKQKKELE